jgi:hypothetical protein
MNPNTHAVFHARVIHCISLTRMLCVHLPFSAIAIGFSLKARAGQYDPSTLCRGRGGGGGGRVRQHQQSVHIVTPVHICAHNAHISHLTTNDMTSTTKKSAYGNSNVNGSSCVNRVTRVMINNNNKTQTRGDKQATHRHTHTHSEQIELQRERCRRREADRRAQQHACCYQ